ncbi:MAG: thioredoxin domain-containing protein [Deltaproteobacteria bacterium]|nr:thioredoxin domain-containing protein [Deltaproteobacteria bacterium]
MKKLVLAALAFGALAACQKSEGVVDHLPKRGESDKPVTMPKPAVASSAKELKPTGTVEERLGRLEKRVNQITAILEQALPPKEPDPAKHYAAAISPIDPVEGPADAKVTIVEGYEFLCPYCWKASATVEQIRAAYPKDVRVVNKYFLIHGPPAIGPGMAACAASKQGKFSEMKKAIWGKLFNEEGKVQQDQLGADNMKKLAADLGLKADQFEADMNSPECQGWLESSQATLQPLGTTGTPSFYINGRHVGGALPFEQMKAIIDEELAAADKAIAGGVKQAEYYNQEILGKGETHVAGYFDE